MAKNIKAIKCPNCGSIKKLEIRTDYFRCLNCDTEYFLDDDDINININHSPYQGSSVSAVPKKKHTAYNNCSGGGGDSTVGYSKRTYREYR